jgi:hypothetical protein
LKEYGAVGKRGEGTERIFRPKEPEKASVTKPSNNRQTVQAGMFLRLVHIKAPHLVRKRRDIMVCTSLEFNCAVP